MTNAGLRSGKLYIGEDNLIFWGDPDDGSGGLFDRNTRQYINDATVAFALKNSAGSTVSGGTGGMTYVTGSNGCYTGVLEDGVALTEGSTYYLEVTATASSDRIGFRRIAYIATYHGSD